MARRSPRIAVRLLAVRPLTAREFAVSVGIALKTASSHVEHILAKLGASGRTEIAARASHVDRSSVPH